mmetsp:Transcript_22642/g.52262  ORF Transcript_22642/g.52262 Transcript_22642/m.52262 type:complete len:262 (+) Transcript_22642:1258-2043(+)
MSSNMSLMGICEIFPVGSERSSIIPFLAWPSSKRSFAISLLASPRSLLSLRFSSMTDWYEGAAGDDDDDDGMTSAPQYIGAGHIIGARTIPGVDEGDEGRDTGGKVTGDRMTFMFVPAELVALWFVVSTFISGTGIDVALSASVSTRPQLALASIAIMKWSGAQLGSLGGGLTGMGTSDRGASCWIGVVSGASCFPDAVSRILGIFASTVLFSMAVLDRSSSLALARSCLLVSSFGFAFLVSSMAESRLHIQWSVFSKGFG